MVPQVVVIGSFVRATVVETRRLPVRGESLLAKSVRTAHGGKGFNMALQVARLGNNALVLGTIGADSAGCECLALMKREGISTEWIRRITGQPTATGVVIRDIAGSNLIAVYPGVSMALTRADVDRMPLPHVQGSVMLAQLEVPFDTALYAIERAHSTGITTILNPAPARDLRDTDLGTVDYLTPNETEARVCAGYEPDDVTVSHDVIARRLLDTGCRNVVITTGAEGCEYYGSDGSMHVPAYPVTVVDTTGAGDAFNGALAVAVAYGCERLYALRFASAAAALCCTVLDTIDAFAFRDNVERMLE